MEVWKIGSYVGLDMGQIYLPKDQGGLGIKNFKSCLMLHCQMEVAVYHGGGTNIGFQATEFF
jgi:hypothetical protein